MTDLNQLAKRIHELNKRWWQDIETGQPIERNKGELLALAIGEVAEALEGERKNKMDDHLPHRRNAEVEMADAYIRLLDFAGGFGLSHRRVICVEEHSGEELEHPSPNAVQR